MIKFVIKPARRGVLRRKQTMFDIVAANGNIYAWSEGYNNPADCETAVQRIIDEIQADAVAVVHED